MHNTMFEHKMGLPDLDLEKWASIIFRATFMHFYPKPVLSHSSARKVTGIHFSGPIPYCCEPPPLPPHAT
jgi:hypothetical protein